MIIASSNVDRFTKFFHCQIPKDIWYTHTHQNIPHLILNMFLHYLVKLDNYNCCRYLSRWCILTLRQTSSPVPPPGHLDRTTFWRPTGAANWRTGRNIRVVFDSGLCPALCENMTSSTKPEVRIISHGRQRRNESRSQVTCTENVVKFGRVVFDIIMQADRQTIKDKQTNKLTYRQADHNTFHHTIFGGEVVRQRTVFALFLWSNAKNVYYLQIGERWSTR